MAQLLNVASKCPAIRPYNTPQMSLPIQHHPQKNNTEPPKPPPQQQTDLSKINKDEEEFFIKCPTDTDPKIGNFANDLKLTKSLVIA